MNIDNKKINNITLVRVGKYREGLIVPLGILYLAGYLRDKIRNINIQIIDAVLENLPIEELIRRIIISKPDVVGLSGLTVDTSDIISTANLLNSSLDDTIVVTGGPAVSSNYNEIFERSSIDYGVVGEGEEVFFRLVESINSSADVQNIQGLVYRKNGVICINPSTQYIRDLDAVPYPAYDMINPEEYFISEKRNTQSPVYISKRCMPVITSRGCPYRCIYCHKLFGKTFRARSADNVVNEIVLLKNKYNIEELEIIDDIFNYDIARAKDIIHKIIVNKLNIKISFPSGLKYEMIDDELLKLFKNAGVYRIALGIESANKRIQNVIGKRVDLLKTSSLIDKCSKMGLFVSGFFQLGLPGETKDEMMDTVNYATSSNLHTAMFHLTVPFPGTLMHDKYIKDKYDSHNYKSARDISVNLSKVSDNELLRIKRHAFIKFYFNFRRIFSIYRVFPIKRRLFYNFVNVISEILFRKWIIQT